MSSDLHVCAPETAASVAASRGGTPSGAWTHRAAILWCTEILGLEAPVGWAGLPDALQSLAVGVAGLVAIHYYPPTGPGKHHRTRLVFATEEAAQAHQRDIRCGGWRIGADLYPGVDWYRDTIAAAGQGDLAACESYTAEVLP